MNIEEMAQRADALNQRADAAVTDGERLNIVRAGLSSNKLGSSVTTPKNLAAFIAACWDQGLNPLPGFRKRLGPTWAVIAHCWASQGEPNHGEYVGELFLSLQVGASEIMFRRLK